MRIVLVISGLTLGGAQRQVVLLAKELVSCGHAVCVYLLNRELARAPELEGSGVELVVDSKRLRLDPAVLLRLRRHVRQWGADVVHGFLYDGNLYARLACAGLGLAVLNSERNDNYRLSAAQALGYRMTPGLCDAVIANSHAGARFAASLHRIGSDRVPVVWNGIDLREVDARLVKARPVARELWPGDGLKRLLIVGAIKPSKDWPLALRVLRALLDADPSWRFLCAGDELSDQGSLLKRAVLEQCERTGLSASVKFLGNRTDVCELMASSDVLLVTSLHEGFPNVVLEAMACGTPVVSTDYSDVRRILPFAWQICGDRSVDALAAAAERCTVEPERATLIARQRAWVETHATSAAMAGSMLAAYAPYLRFPSTLTRSAL